MDVQCIIHGRNSYIDRSYSMQPIIIKTSWKEKYVINRLCWMSDRTIRIHGQAREFLLVTWMLYHQRNLFCTIKLCNLRNVRRCCRIWSVENTFTSGEFHLRDRICWYKLGNGITAAVLTQLLAFSGYVSKAGVTTQPQSVVNMIMNIYKVGPLIVWVTVVIILLLYRLDKKYPMIMKELEEREARGEL